MADALAVVIERSSLPLLGTLNCCCFTAKVLVSEVDEKQQARDRERARLDEEGRLLEQLRHAEALGAVKRGQVSTGNCQSLTL